MNYNVEVRDDQGNKVEIIHGNEDTYRLTNSSGKVLFEETTGNNNLAAVDLERAITDPNNNIP